ncbi:MAG: DEAD/DEAH box helicase [Planctomycetota bacterium]
MHQHDVEQPETGLPEETFVSGESLENTEASFEVDGDGAEEEAEEGLIEIEDSLDEVDSLDESEEEAVSGPLPAGVPAPLRAAMERQGFTGLTLVQESALEALSAGRDLRISSQTGSGKTVAIGIVMSPDLISEAKEPRPRGESLGPVALVLVPTRELAGQVQRELMWLFKDVRNLRVECVTGGTPFGPEVRRLETSPLVLVGTPGRVLDHVRRETLDLNLVRQVVLDEADQMLDMGFRDELEAILEATPDEKHTHLVSATFSPAIQQLAAQFQEDALHVEGTRLGEANADIEHVGHWVNRGDRYPVLVNLLLLAGEERAIVFVATRASAATLASQLASDGFAAAALSGDLAQKQRERTLAAFQSGALRILVATDVAARGLDVPNVPLVIQGEPPRDGEVYVHRSGRTGRAGAKGMCVLLGPAHQKRRMMRLMDEAGIEVDWRPLPTEPQVRYQLEQRLVDGVAQALEQDEAAWSSRMDLAGRLLELGEAQSVLAAVLAQESTRSKSTAPRSISGATGSGGAGGRERSGGFERPERFDRAPVERGPEPGFTTRFAINWGRSENANPRRLLALICRRGNIQSKDVGKIRIGDRSSYFEGADVVLEAFAAKVAEHDPVDPGIQIRRAQPGEDAEEGPRGGRFGGGARRGGFQRGGRGGFRGGRGGFQRGGHRPFERGERTFEGNDRDFGRGHRFQGADEQPQQRPRFEGGPGDRFGSDERPRGGFGGARGGFGGPRGGFGGGRGHRSFDGARPRPEGEQGFGDRDNRFGGEREDRGFGGPRRRGGPDRFGNRPAGRSARYQAQDTPPPRHPDEGRRFGDEGFQPPSMYGRPRFGGGGGGGRRRSGGGRGRGGRGRGRY